jgi:hypothetical protein
LPSSRERTATTAGKDDGEIGSSSPPHWPEKTKQQRDPALRGGLYDGGVEGQRGTATTAEDDDGKNGI